MLELVNSKGLLFFIWIVYAYYMDAGTYIKNVGEIAAETACKQAGTKLVYLKQIASGHRRPSPELAKKLVKASGNQLDFEALLFARK